jgi:GntR family transcriptional regulator/MocR family aminotransferase
MKAVPVPVDAEGLRVDTGIATAPDAAFAIVTPGQQAPTGVQLSLERRRSLLAWAAREDGWIIEDDYLGGLQLSGRAAPALAADDPGGRVIYIGTFSKTLSPVLGLGFVVAPLSLAERFGEVAAYLNPAPNSTTQLALAGFLGGGHFLRHLRHMKQLYRERRDALHRRIGPDLGIEAFAALGLVARLPKGMDDVALARRAVEKGVAPCPLSLWYSNPAEARSGLILSVTNLKPNRLDRACETLVELIAEEA